MNKIFRVIMLAAVAALGLWVWTLLFPNPKHVIGNRLNQLARLASFSPGEGTLSRAFDVKRLGGLFSDDAQILVDVPALETHEFGRDEMMQDLLAAKKLGNGLKVKFIDPNIELGTGAESALVDLTMEAKFGGESDLVVQELKFTMKKIKSDWLITRVETVNTLKP
jgi:hypothetical protein